MSSATRIATPASAPRSEGVTLLRVLRSEWIKLRSLRSTTYSLLAAVVVAVGLGTLFGAVTARRIDRMTPAEVAHLDPTLVSLRGMFLAQLAVGVLGVLVISGEYSTGMIRSSLAAVPRRLPVLIAKSAIFAATVCTVMLGASVAAFTMGQKMLSARHLQASFSTPGAERAVVGAALYLTLIGLFAVGLGFLLRNTAGAIATLFGALLVLPILAGALPSPWSTDVGKYLPMDAGTQIMITRPDTGSLGPWTGLGVLGLYAVAALAAGAFVLHRRDA